jgi:hypothetical protein
MRARVRLDEELAGALNAEPPVSMHAVAAQLGYSSAASLRRRNPDICDQISDRYRRATIRTQAAPLTAVPSNGVIKRALCRALAHTPRVPLKTVTRNLGFKNVVAHRIGLRLGAMAAGLALVRYLHAKCSSCCLNV